MKRLYFIVPLLLTLVAVGCNDEPTKKKYEDYNEEDFVEVQGIVTKVEKQHGYQSLVVNISYIYNLDQEKPTKGYEADSPFIPIEGGPAIILVHKDDENVSFFSQSGILDEEEEVLLSYLEKCEQMGGGYYGVDD